MRGVIKAAALPARQEVISTYNGTNDESYSWAQTDKDVTIQVATRLLVYGVVFVSDSVYGQAFLAKGTRAREVDVQFEPTRLRVGLKGQVPIIDGALHERVQVDDCTWNLEVANGELTITLEVTPAPRAVVRSVCQRQAHFRFCGPPVCA